MEVHSADRVKCAEDATCQVLANGPQFLHPHHQFPFQAFEALHQPECIGREATCSYILWLGVYTHITEYKHMITINTGEEKINKKALKINQVVVY